MNFSSSYAVLFFVLFFLSSCATLQVARDVQSGRTALKLGQPKEAITHFEAAGQSDPDYLTDFTLLDIGIFSYVGMAYYQAGEKEKALESFKQAKQRHSEDHFARVFLGLTLSQTGQTREGKTELVAGLNGLGNWLDMTRRSNVGKAEFWDPGDSLANEIAQTLKLLQTEEINWQAVDEKVVTLAMNFDDEIDEVKRDFRFEVNDDDGSGGKT